MEHSKLKLFYDIFIVILAIASILLTVLELFGKISLSVNPFMIIDTSILIIFAIDYITRFIISKGKWEFFKKNIFDLLAIFPFNSVFSFFRFARLFRLAKFTRILKFTRFIRLVGFIGKIKPKLDRFLHTNGFIYIVYCSLGLILTSSVLMSFIEEQSFLDALWWSIVTATTVGYGDISPSTAIGRIIAVILMLFGIGFIGMLTGTITSYFSNKLEKKDESAVNCETLNDITNDMSQKQIDELTTFAKAIKSGLIK